MEEKARSLALTLAVVLVMATTMEMVLASGTGTSQGFCNMTRDGLMACKPSISAVKPVEKPVDECCTALANADLPCLCAYKNSGMLPYLGIDPNRAMQLPAKCSLPAPPQC